MKNDNSPQPVDDCVFPIHQKKDAESVLFFVPHIYNKKQTAKAVCFSYP